MLGNKGGGGWMLNVRGFKNVLGKGQGVEVKVIGKQQRENVHHRIGGAVRSDF